MRILLAEDEKDLNEVIVKTLEKNGYSVDSCLDGREALYYLENTEYDAAILDIMMPGMSGIEVLKAIRSRGSTLPVLFLTARDSVSQRVEGLDAGADDYLVKPFAFDELLARIRVLLRKKSGSAQNLYQLANLKVDLTSHSVFRDDTPILLSAKEFSILEYMILNQGIVLSREKIEEHIWNYDYQGGSNLVDVYIRYLRKKIDEPFSPKLIHTVRGVGYVLKE
ncbi:MAG: response regulator transcription factor [Lachnospiraceae bacterium]|nr:response regulator transcription factor [Lachnospiraceae bacterium]MCI7595598.1 response regulator transcription factor [Lachnospiraceae bacterium]MDD7049466.1 response regulator transcription factor [Lachnospiraceae bacterium]MDY3222061.1 response regulator transcription factor [Lachnospiraceae bacterium]